MRKLIVGICCVGMAASLTTAARMRSEASAPPDRHPSAENRQRTLSTAEMERTTGGYQTCSGIDCNGTTSCTAVNSGTFTGSKKVVYHPHSVCIFTFWEASCSEFWTNQVCTETYYYTDGSCSVLAPSTPASPNPQVTSRNFCGL